MVKYRTYNNLNQISLSYLADKKIDESQPKFNFDEYPLI